MKRYSTSLILFALISLSCGRTDHDPMKIHRDALVADMHSDTALRMRKGFDISIRDTTGHMDIPRLQEGGVDLQVFACFVSTETPPDSCRPKVDELLDSLQAQITANPDKIAICKSAAEAEEIIEQEEIAAFIGVENGVAIANRLENLQHYYDRGVRYMTLTHTSSNDWCISSADTLPAFHGLTDFGRDVIRKMNELGMIIDISHASPEAVEEVLKVTSDPVIASHSCAQSICPGDRNLTDEQIRTVAENGGVIGINFFNGYLSKEWIERADSLYDAREPEIDSLWEQFKDDDSALSATIRRIYNELGEELKTIAVNVGTVVDHIDHIVKVAGPDYVGLGSDFDGVFSLPAGLSDCSMMPNITIELVNRGYSEKDIAKILGGNFMRVFKKVCDR